MAFLELKPKPSYFIKSISEQGYLLETALADLIDNSISAKASEINIYLTEYDKEPTIFIADNGSGMSNSNLIEALRMPSQSLEEDRLPTDLGRFGLGLKTASFSQARKITVISRDFETNTYNGYCWDIINLDVEWNLNILDDNPISNYINAFKQKRNNSNLSSEAEINTLVIWEHLFREENIENLQKYLIEEVQSHLSLVFHRFLKDDNFIITIGNIQLLGFDPFPSLMSRLPLFRFYHDDGRQVNGFTVQGFTLPYSVLKNKSDDNLDEWLIKGRNLSDMEGIYLYRENRLIYYGGWSRLQRRNQSLKLARLMINITNKHDHLFQINVAKSTMQIPQTFKPQIKEIIEELAEQAKTVYFQKEHRNSLNPHLNNTHEILNKEIGNKGVIFTLNKENDAYNKLNHALTTSVHRNLLNAYVKSIIKKLNKYVNYDNGNVEEVLDEEITNLSEEELQSLRDLGISDYMLKDLKH